MKKIVVIGSLNMDFITQTPRIPKIGETIIGDSFGIACGGKGGNQAYAVAKLGGNVSFFGCTGNDIFATKLIDNLESVGVNCENVKKYEDIHTGVATILLQNGDNCIIVSQGANTKADVNYIKEKEDLLNNADLIIMQLEIPLDTVKYVCDFAKKNNIKVLMNPAPAATLPEDIFSEIEYFVVNETECEFYTGKHIACLEDAIEGIKKILALGCKNAIVTLGGDGCVYNDVDGEIKHKEALKVKAIDTTAAGDTFIGAFCVKIMEGCSITEAISFGTKASAITVTRVGAQQSIPSIEEIQ